MQELLRIEFLLYTCSGRFSNMASSPTPKAGFAYNWLLGENGWKPGMDENWLKADTLINSTYGWDRINTVGLTYAWLGGYTNVNNVFTVVVGGTIILPNNSTRYLERSQLTGTVTAGVGTFSYGELIPMAVVVTAGGAVTSVTDARFYGDPYGVTMLFNKLRHGFYTDAQTQANIIIRDSAALADSIEWGHPNPAGYANTIGFKNGTGNGYIAFNAVAGTNTNTFKTLGIFGTVIMADLLGGISFNLVAAANADNQGLTELLRVGKTSIRAFLLHTIEVVGQALTLGVSASAGSVYQAFTNTSALTTNAGIVGIEGNPAGTIVNNSLPGDLGIRSASGINFTADAGATRALRIDNSNTAGETRLLIWDNSTATLRRVKIVAGALQVV